MFGSPYANTSFFSSATWQEIGMWSILGSIGVITAANVFSGGEVKNEADKVLVIDAATESQRMTVEELTELYNKFYQNEVKKFIASIPIIRKTFTQSQLVREEVSAYADSRVQKLTRINNYAAKSMMRSYFILEGALLWMCGKQMPIKSWKASDTLGLTSPIELWADLNWECFKIFHLEDSPLFATEETLSNQDKSLLLTREREFRDFGVSLISDCVNYESEAVANWLKQSIYLETPVFQDMKMSKIPTTGLIMQCEMPEELLLNATIRILTNDKLQEIKTRFFTKSPQTWDKYLSRFVRKLSGLKQLDDVTIQKAIEAVYGGLKVVFG